jgi:ferredoxin
MRVAVDLSLCQGYANCIAMAPEVFDLDDDGLVKLLQVEPPAEFDDVVRDAVQLCPVQAISIAADEDE